MRGADSAAQTKPMSDEITLKPPSETGSPQPGGRGLAVGASTLSSVHRNGVASDGLIWPVLEQIFEFAELEPNWDSYGAQPISLLAVKKAVQLLSQLAAIWPAAVAVSLRPYDVAPLSNGGVQLEWRSSKGSLEVEINPGAGYGYLLSLGQGAERRFEEADHASLTDILHLFPRLLPEH